MIPLVSSFYSKRTVYTTVPTIIELKTLPSVQCLLVRVISIDIFRYLASMLISTGESECCALACMLNSNYAETLVDYNSKHIVRIALM